MADTPIFPPQDDTDGPNVIGDNAANKTRMTMNDAEVAVFNSLIRADDSYDENGVYWADMNIAKRAKFVSKVDREESARELKEIGRMMKEDPLSPVGYYARNMIIPGAGLLLEGYAAVSYYATQD